MRLRLGPPPDSLTAAELASGQWQRLRMLPMWAFQLAAYPIGIALALLLFVCWIVLTPAFEIAFAEPELVLPVVITTVVMGPLLQIAAHPPAGRYRLSTLGFWPSRLLLYTGYSDKLGRSHYLAVLVLPFLLMALGPLLFVLSTGLQSGWLVFVSCLSAATFGVNLVLALVAAWQLPANAQVGGMGFQSYWRSAE